MDVSSWIPVEECGPGSRGASSRSIGVDRWTQQASSISASGLTVMFVSTWKTSAITVRLTSFAAGAVKRPTYSASDGRTVRPSSSASSRQRACTGSSWVSIFPPGCMKAQAPRFLWLRRTESKLLRRCEFYLNLTWGVSYRKGPTTPMAAPGSIRSFPTILTGAATCGCLPSSNPSEYADIGEPEATASVSTDRMPA
jgi:hypothetical protein